MIKLPITQKHRSISLNLLKIFSIALVLMLAFSVDADAQNRKKKKKSSSVDEYFDESGFGAFRFWYGGGLGLGFSGGTFSSQFDISISPMVGYKITPEFSIGPRIELSYTHYRLEDFNGGVDKFNFFNYGVGIFSRYKFFEQVFGHVEYQIESREFILGGVQQRSSFDNFYLGAGYTSGGQIAYEISLLWNLLDEETVDLPLDFRLAFTYNF